MNCDQVQEQLCEYIDGRMDAPTGAELAAHLKGCADCSEIAASLRSTVDMVAAEAQIEPPIGFTTRVMAHVQEQALEPTGWQRWAAWVRSNFPLQAAAVVLVAVLGVLLYQKQNSQTEKPPEQMVQRNEEQTKLPAAEKPAPDMAAPLNAPPADVRKDSGSLAQRQVQEADQDRRRGSGGASALAPAAPSSSAESDDVDREIVVRLRDTPGEAKSLADRLEPSALRKERGSSLPPDVQKSIAEARGRARQSGAPQVVWLNFPIDAYEQFTQDLAASGVVESNVAHRSQIAAAARAGGNIRVKVTILAPANESK